LLFLFFLGLMSIHRAEYYLPKACNSKAKI
jgi:hypothetical protein